MEEETADHIYNSKCKIKQKAQIQGEFCKTYMRTTRKHSHRTKSRLEQIEKHTLFDQENQYQKDIDSLNLKLTNLM